MKRWIYLLAILIVLIITGSWFAYTFPASVQQIRPATGSDVAMVKPIENPVWNQRIFGNYIGKIEPVDLFKIIPDDDYPGDLRVTVYLINADELIHCYQYLIMKTEIYDNNGNQAGRTEFITLQNGQANFELISGAGWISPYTVKITGGSYYCIRGEIEEGGSLSPTLYCQVTPK